MHVEFKNVTTGKYYYLCGADGVHYGLTWTPDIVSRLTSIDPSQTVADLCDTIRPVVNRLMGDDYHKWEVTIFRLPEDRAHSLTSPADIIQRFDVGDVNIINGVRQPTLFHPQ